MNKSLLVVLCLLAFAAGGGAHLVLRRTSAPKVKSELVEVKPEPPAPAAPQTAEAEARATEEAKPAEEVQPAEEAKPADAAAVPEAPAAAAPPARRPPAAARTTRAATRPRAAQVVPAAPPPAPVNNVEAAGGGRSLKDATVGGAKKTGRLLGKGLKRLGGVFH
jgi:uncharacterized iron-regulated membrane protein